MQPSRSKAVAFESISMAKLFESGLGAIGIYIPNTDYKNAIARISSNAKAVATSTNQRCIVETLAVISGISEGDKGLSAQRWVKITVTSKESMTERGKRYNTATKGIE
ncbi:hypothetical protein [Shewanella algae]|uniref:hypothetical protein n=1 Tax=Shewanella TaxID=22 RepID=UPI0031F543E7